MPPASKMPVTKPGAETFPAVGKAGTVSVTPKRFWEKVQIGEPDECWPYQGFRTERGYGRFYAWERPICVVVRAHRLACWFGNGPFDLDLLVRHSCENTSCCNPRHLTPGTPADNSRDYFEIGDRRNLQRGTKRPNAKLTDEKVAQIRATYRLDRLGDRGRAAREFGVSKRVIEKILTGTAWAHVSSKEGFQQ